jgi:hypothetical protein
MRGIKAVKKVHYEEMLFECRNGAGLESPIELGNKGEEVGE